MCKPKSLRQAAALVCCAVGIVGSWQYARAQTPARNYKSQDEYEIYTGITKDFAAGDFSKVIAGLETWKQKYAESDFRNERQLLYVQAYFGANQPGKAIDAAAPLLSSDPDVLLGDPAAVVRLLYTATTAILRLADPTPDQLATAGKAARQLAAYNKAPQGVAASDWERARTDLQATARGTLLHIALVPLGRAMRVNDCSGLEAASRKVLESYPNSAQAAWYLASAALCLYKSDPDPDKASLAIYEFARAAALDPVAAMVDPKWQKGDVEPNLDKIYGQYHGPDPEGLKQLKELAVNSPLPPPGFTIKSKLQIAQAKQEAFERDNPELALWMKIKAALSESNGEQYFVSELKDSAVPWLRGVVLEARPECRPAELRIGIRTTEASQPLLPEVVLKLDKPLSGKPEPASDIRWQGVATAFTKDPFLLKMEVETAKLDGLRTSPCTPPSAKKK